MHDYALTLPEDFADYEREVPAKGCYAEALLVVAGVRYRLNFYDAHRLQQEIQSALELGSMFFEPNLFVIKTVDQAELEAATELLVRSGSPPADRIVHGKTRGHGRDGDGVHRHPLASKAQVGILHPFMSTKVF